nr:hypothetical protein GCM10020092_052980 [Actinoplanes digitatis]
MHGVEQAQHPRVEVQPARHVQLDEPAQPLAAGRRTDDRGPVRECGAAGVVRRPVRPVTPGELAHRQPGQGGEGGDLAGGLSEADDLTEVDKQVRPADTGKPHGRLLLMVER